MAEGFKLFGFEITRAKDNKAIKSIVPPRDDDGAGYVTATSAGSHYGHYINMEGDDSKDQAQLILNQCRKNLCCQLQVINDLNIIMHLPRKQLFRL